MSFLKYYDKMCEGQTWFIRNHWYHIIMKCEILFWLKVYSFVTWSFTYKVGRHVAICTKHLHAIVTVDFNPAIVQGLVCCKLWANSSIQPFPCTCCSTNWGMFEEKDMWIIPPISKASTDPMFWTINIVFSFEGNRLYHATTDFKAISQCLKYLKSMLGKFPC